MTGRWLAATMLVVGLVAQGCVTMRSWSGTTAGSTAAGRIALPSPATSGGVSLEEAMARRRSVRELAVDPLGPAEIGQLLWAGQGVTDGEGHRTAPSAGATYPLELYAITAEGVFHYLPTEHAIDRVRAGDLRPQLRVAARDQAQVGDAPLVIVIAAVLERTAARYGDRARRYVDMEVGHAAQNILLEAVALGLASVPVGSFDDAVVAGLIGLPAGEAPLYLLPVGRSRDGGTQAVPVA